MPWALLEYLVAFLLQVRQALAGGQAGSDAVDTAPPPA